MLHTIIITGENTHTCTVAMTVLTATSIAVAAEPVVSLNPMRDDAMKKAA
jgi:hypothetical protein